MTCSPSTFRSAACKRWVALWLASISRRRPALTFKSKRVEPGAAGKFKLIGDLTIRGNTKEVVLEVEGPSPVVKRAGRNGAVTLLTGASATTKISRKEFGVLWNNLIESMPVVGDEVIITIDLELNRPGT